MNLPFSSCKKPKTLNTLNGSPSFALPQAPGIYRSTSWSTSLTTSDSACKWDRPSVFPGLTGIVHLALHPPDPSVWQHAFSFLSFEDRAYI